MSSTASKYYLTTPIYYVNSKPHIGTSYTTILTDVVSRYRRLCGYDTLLVTGSDEHSQNIADLAEQAGKSPKAFCDEIIPRFTDCWSHINIQRYEFLRTSSTAHCKLVQRFWQTLYDKGDVYKGEYAGWYHTSDNRFLDEDEVPENPEAHPRLKYLTEETYYFKLSAYQDWLLSLYEARPDFVRPDFRRNEMLSRINQGLKDISISRTSTTWGIPLPWDEKHVFYVWIEALLTYMTGSGFDIEAYLKTMTNGRSSETKSPLWETTRADLVSQPAGNYWPADLHVMAKDIPWFHAVIWPAMLNSFGAPLPKQLLVHGYWQFEGEKMSKSLGNVVDPYDAVKLVGVDGLRYFLMREVPAGRDGSFSYAALIKRYNYDLANDLGNLVHRTVSLLHQLFDGVVPTPPAGDELDQKRRETINSVRAAYEDLRPAEALQQIWSLVGLANQYIDQKKPWALKKQPQREREVAHAFYTLLDTIRTVTLLAYPVIPGACNRFWRILNLDGTLEEQTLSALEERMPQGHKLNVSEAVFKRLDNKVLKQAQGEGDASTEGQQTAQTPASTKTAEKKSTRRKTGEQQPGDDLIGIDDFFRVAFRVAEVRSVERVPKADKLLKLTVFDGERERQIVSGIAQHYEPEQLQGKKVVLVANLKPAKLRGIVSEGMLLAAEDENGLSIVTLDRDVTPGAKVS